jgi:hypothetical protein
VYDDSSEWHTVSSSVGTDERVDDLKEDESVAMEEYLDARDVWSSGSDVFSLHAPSGVTNEVLVHHLKLNYFAEGLAVLQLINLSDTQVTDTTVVMLANACPGLKNVNLINTQVTDISATAFASACPDLRIICLAKSQVTPSLAKQWFSEEARAVHFQYVSSTGQGMLLSEEARAGRFKMEKPIMQHPLYEEVLQKVESSYYGGTIADFRWELNRITKKKKKGKGKKKRR